MSDHAPLMPNAAARWPRCAGSVAMEAAVPNLESEDSRNGTAAHWVAERGFRSPYLVVGGGVADNGVVITQEMVDGAKLYVEYVHGCVPVDTVLHIEERTKPGGIHAQCWGTPDLWALQPEYGLHLFDYKFGYRPVEVFENPQLICYAADILAAQTGPVDPSMRVTFHIIQPRGFHRDGRIRAWDTTAGDILRLARDLRPAAERAIAPNAPTQTSVEACRDCRARTRCPAFQAACLGAAEVAGQSVPFDLSDAEAGRFLTLVQHASKQLKAMETGLNAQLTAALVSGRSVPGWCMEQGRANEAWTQTPAEIAALGVAFGVDLVSKVVTPNQARKAGIDESVISAYSLRPKGAVKLAPVDFSKSRKVFSK